MRKGPKAMRDNLIHRQGVLASVAALAIAAVLLSFTVTLSAQDTSETFPVGPHPFLPLLLERVLARKAKTIQVRKGSQALPSFVCHAVDGNVTPLPDTGRGRGRGRPRGDQTSPQNEMRAVREP